MRHRKTLLASAVAAIAAVAAAPWVQRHVEERRILSDGEQRALWIELKEKELACLERLQAIGLQKRMDLAAEIERCKALATDPATGKPVELPGER